MQSLTRIILLGMGMTFIFFQMGGISVGEEDYCFLTGAEVSTIESESYIDGKLIIELGKIHPGNLRDSTGTPDNHFGIAEEGITIFGDGICFSTKMCYENYLNEFLPAGYILDDTWRTNYVPRHTPIYYRECMFQISVEQIDEILQLISVYDSVLSPGDSIIGQTQAAGVRVIFDGREGRLIEMLGYKIENEEKLAVIESVVAKAREYEWESDIEVLEYSDYLGQLHDKREEWDWTRPDNKSSRRFGTLREAWEAHGLSYPEG